MYTNEETCDTYYTYNQVHTVGCTGLDPKFRGEGSKS